MTTGKYLVLNTLAAAYVLWVYKNAPPGTSGELFWLRLAGTLNIIVAIICALQLMSRTKRSKT